MFRAAPKRLARPGRQAVAGLMLLLWLSALAVASSPELHRLLHSDAKSPNHQCLVTQLQHHSVLAASAAVIAPDPPAHNTESAPCLESQFSSSYDYRLSPSRGPPSFVSSIKVVG